MTLDKYQTKLYGEFLKHLIKSSLRDDLQEELLQQFIEQFDRFERIYFA